jgi:hypothetical protein
VAKVELETPGGTVLTDADGHAFAAGLGDGALVRAGIDTEQVDDPFLVGGDGVQLVPRPGRTALIAYPLMIPTRYARQYQGEVIQALQDRPPEAIVVSPGTAFGAAGEGFVRVSLVPTMQDIEEAIERWRTVR